MRPARSRRSLYGCLAEGNGTDESSDVSLAEEESEEVRSSVHSQAWKSSASAEFQ